MRSALTLLRREYAAKMKGLILDCGAGDGLYTPLLDGTVIALDNERVVERKGKRVVVGDAAFLPFRDRSFDSVWACAVIEHVRMDTIPEMKRIVKHNGQIVVLTPNRYSPVQLVKNLWGHPGWWGHEGHVRLYNYGQLRQYGTVLGEWICRWKWVDRVVRRMPLLGNTLMLYIGGVRRKG